jgi:prevent-host-death family protein
MAKGLHSRTIGDAKAHFAECIREAEAGGSIVLTRHGREVARLGPIGAPDPREGEGCRPATRAREDCLVAGGIAESVTPYAAMPDRAFQAAPARRAALRRRLDEEIWPRIPEELLGTAITKREREEILGYASSSDGASTDETSDAGDAD